jgi:hypothetical protein
MTWYWPVLLDGQMFICHDHPKTAAGAQVDLRSGGTGWRHPLGDLGGICPGGEDVISGGPHDAFDVCARRDSPESGSYEYVMSTVDPPFTDTRVIYR